ncbi:MAG: rRNA pseudouridine synthase [Desulfovibrio sp.]|nr:rRNA pseudouridine synthase [Desulfovibrio sp.]
MPEIPPNRQHTSPDKESIRLNKILAWAGICSRRKADALITAGAVAVNGITVTEPGLRVRSAKDRITVDGRPVSRTGIAPVYLLLHKPVQVVATARDPQGRATVLDLVPAAYRKERLYPVGRLDYFSEGLTLLTNDGPLTHRLTHPNFHLPRVYEVTLREKPGAAQIDRMREGMILAEGEQLLPVRVEILSPHILRLTLEQGINRQIRRICRDLELTILRLRRTAFGPLLLEDLPPGRCRPLRPEEIAALSTYGVLASPPPVHAQRKGITSHPSCRPGNGAEGQKPERSG